VALGAIIAYEYFIRDGVRGMTALGELSVASLQEMFVNLQRDTGTDQEYEQALREYLSVLERLRKANPNSEDATALSLSRMATLGRLSLMAEKRGANAEATELIQTAARECVDSGRPECSPEKMRQLAHYFDKGRSGQSAK